MLLLEIQRGKKPMWQLPYHAELGATAACTRRLSEGAAYSGLKYPSRQRAAFDEEVMGGESFKGDSWFTGVPSVESAADAGHAYFGALKTSTKCTPYEELIDKMKEWPSGSHLVMECHTPKGHDLICIGYKYSSSKVLVFLGTKNAGSTKPGEPYIARFPDANGNVAQRSVPRPDIISKYFKDSNVIDSHNQARQGELKLEKRWVTQDCWFRINTTLIAMTVTDCWRAFKHALTEKKHKELSIKGFADRMTYDCIYNSYSDIASLNGFLRTADEAVPNTVAGEASNADDVSAVTAPTTNTSVMADHSFVKNYDMERMANGKSRPKRRVCRADGCSKEQHFRCSNPRCERFNYKCGAGRKYGVFYCTEHFGIHFQHVLNDTNGGF
jgi:hypothetical protein